MIFKPPPDPPEGPPGCHSMGDASDVPECWPRCLGDAKAAALDSALTERQIAVYSGILVLGQAQGHFALQDPPRLLAANFVAMEDGYQMEILAGRRTRTEVITALSSYARAVTGHAPPVTPVARTSDRS